MEHWEFLLQKEGDRSWLPLETPDVEILEGRYRVVARSNRVNAPVEVRITHQSTEEFPPKRRLQKRSARTSPDGLMVVIPFTRLKAGIWELRCIGDVTPDKQGENWQHSVLLQVLPIDADEFVDLESDYPSASAGTAQLSPPSAATEQTAESEPTQSVTLTPLPAQIAPSKVSQFPSQLTGGRVSVPGTSSSEPPPTPVTLNLEQPTGNTQPEFNTQHSTLSNHQPLQLTLDRETYMVSWGEPFTLSGRLEVPDRINQLPPGVGQLHICLRDPQSGHLVVEIRQPVLAILPEVPFLCTVEIPRDCQTHLILGDVTLYDSSGAALASRSFTITADLDELLGAIADDLTDEDLLDLSRESAGKEQALALNESFLDLVETIRNSPPTSFQPSTNPSLPPKIYQPDAPRPVSKPLDLPTFVRPQPAQTSSKVNVAPAEEASPVSPEETTEAPAAPSDPDSTVGEQSQAASERSPNRAEEETSGIISSTATAESSSIDIAFQALKLQDRFWSRLNALANDEELSEWLKISFSAASSASEIQAQNENANELERATLLPEPRDWEAQEIVVDDEPIEPAVPYRTTGFVDAGRNKAASAGTASNAPVSMLLPEDEPVPMPVLEVPGGELTAGRSVTVLVRLPQLRPRIYVKLWVHDRQNRTVLDGPHWLTEFWPTGFGDVEVKTQLTVPYGSLEVQFEAIAVEMQTERESHKVTLDRMVVPPGPPTLPLGG